MTEIPWYAEASLVAPGRVYAAGTLAQCLRKWNRLPEISQVAASIQLKQEFEGQMRLDRPRIEALAGHPDLRRV